MAPDTASPAAEWREAKDLHDLLQYEVNIAPTSTVLYLEEDGSEVRLCGSFIIKVLFSSVWFAPSQDLTEGRDPALRFDPKKLGLELDAMGSRVEFDRTHYPPCPDLGAAFELKAPEEPKLKKLPGKKTTTVVLGEDATGKFPRRAVKVTLFRYQMTCKYNFKCPLIIDASRLPFDRYEIRIQFGLAPTRMRSPALVTGEKMPKRFEFDIPDLKEVEPKGAKENFYPLPGLISPDYRSKYAKETPKDLMPEYDVERGSTDLCIFPSDYKRPLAYCFVLQRVEIKGILSVLLPLYSLILFSPVCQVFNNEALNDSAGYLATLMLALIAHRAVIDERTRLAAGLSKYDHFFFLAMFMIVIQFVVLIAVREVLNAPEDGDGSSGSSSGVHGGDGGGTSIKARRRSAGESGIHPIQWEVFFVEMLLVSAVVVVDLMALMLQVVSARMGNNKSDIFQINKPYRNADFVMETREAQSGGRSSSQTVEVLLSSAFREHLKELKRLTKLDGGNGPCVAVGSKRLKLKVELKSFLSLLIKATDSQKAPRDILRARLCVDGLPEELQRRGDNPTRVSVLDASPAELLEHFLPWKIANYELVGVSCKELRDYSPQYPTLLDELGGGGDSSSPNRLFILRYQQVVDRDLWLELQLLERPVPERQHLAYRLATNADTMRDMSLFDRLLAVGFGLRLRWFSLQAVRAEWYAFTRYGRGTVARLEAAAASNAHREALLMV